MSGGMPEISVVTVCRNCLEALKATVASVGSQTLAPLEHIVVDGASTDGTREWLEGSRGLRWVSERDGGIYDAMNKGARMAKGRYVLFLNAADTFAAADTLERLSESWPEGEPEIVYGDVLKGASDEAKAASEPRNCHRMFFCHQSCLARRDALLNDPFDPGHPYSADFKWVKRVWKRGGRMAHVPIAIARFDTGGVSNRRRSAGLADNIRVVCEEDSLVDRVRLLPKLIVPYLMCRLRGK